LDVGGSLDWWRMVAPLNLDITIVNLDTKQEDDVRSAGFKFLAADGRHLPFADQSFVLSLSNSVIEHVGDWSDQQRFALELMRTGKSFYLQTPNRWFPIEPHIVAPFIHWLPARAQIPLIRWCSVWGWVTKPSRMRIAEFVNGTRLLGKRELEQLFPGCQIESESFLGMTKSWMGSSGHDGA